MTKNVWVAMSGGVDSAATACLMLQQGYHVEGITLRLHGYKDKPGICGSSEDIQTAADVCRDIGIPHHVLDLTDLFAEKVMDSFVSSYQKGDTPNPCILCNQHLKFGALLDYAIAHGADYMATGHYARVAFDESYGRYVLKKGISTRKDQSYVLYTLSQHQLSHLLLPAGDFEKEDIRQLASDSNLNNADKKDSQDICFVPDGDYVSFLQSYGNVSPEPGDFVDDTGRILGRHRGQECYTIGQRKGLGISAPTPLYVLSKNGMEKTVTLGQDSQLFSHHCTAINPNWVAISGLTEKMTVTAKTRYSQKIALAEIEPLEGGSVSVTFQEPQRAMTSGQAVVFYDGDIVVGGGTIAD